MSRIGRLPIDIPAGVTISVDGQDVAVKGPKGELQLTVSRPIEVKVEEGQVLVSRPDDERELALRSLDGDGLAVDLHLDAAGDVDGESSDS